MRYDAETLFCKAVELSDQGGDALIEAERISDSLLMAKPDKGCFIALAAKIAAAKGQYGIARSLMKQSILRDGSVAEYHNNLGYVCRLLGLQDEGKSAYKRATELSPDCGLFWSNLAGIHVARQEQEEGLRYAEKSLAYDPDNPDFLNNKALLLLELGRWEEAWPIYESRIQTDDPTVKMARKNKHYGRPTPFWDGTKGRTVIVHGEQGIGDEIMFASMLPDVMQDCTVIFDCHDRLQNLFRSSFPSLPVYGTKREEPMNLTWPSLYAFDAKTPIGSLAKFYRNRDEDFPRQAYLRVSPAVERRIGERVRGLGNRLKIGFSWQGGVVNTHRRERSIPLSMWSDLFRLDADFISLQYDADAGAELASFGAPANVHHWPDVVGHPDYEETAGLVANLDLVVSVPQSVVHLAGALGAPTLQLTPYYHMWQMGVYGQDMPWYGSVRSLWQGKDCTWGPVLNQAKDHICSLLRKNIAA